MTSSESGFPQFLSAPSCRSKVVICFRMLFKSELQTLLLNSGDQITKIYQGLKRASRQKIAWFRKKLGPLIGERMRAGYTACVQDEAICVADARLREGVYTYTGSHSKTIVFGLITLDGEGFFQRYGSFTGKEFVEFLKAACERFGKILMITDGAPQHRSRLVREEIGRLDGVELQFLPPGCPDLNAIEEVWRQMKHAVLDVPYVRFSSMCSDIDRWLRSSLPKLDIERYLYRKA